jgi:ADP-dependent phosphofructokinase/glucokinase
MLQPDEIVLGLGGTIDYEIEWDSARIDSLVRGEGITRANLSSLPQVTSTREVLLTLVNFVAEGTGGERFVTDPEVIQQVAEVLPYRVTLGGTPVRAALAMWVRGINSTVHVVSTNDNTRELLPAGTQILSSATDDSLFPHLIFQYPAGAVLLLDDGEVVSTRANRVIYTHDPPNEELLLSPQLGVALHRAKLFLISGLNIFRNETMLRERLSQLCSHQTALPDDALVVYEDAGFHVAGYSTIVRNQLETFIDIHSMNEDEAQEYVGSEVDLADPEDVVAMMKSLREIIHATHLMVHTHLWSVLVGPQAARYSKALDAAVVMASARYHYGDTLTLEGFEEMALRVRNPVAPAVGEALIAEFGNQSVFSPGFALDTDTPTSIGLGDSFIGGFLAELALTSH